MIIYSKFWVKLCIMKYNRAGSKEHRAFVSWDYISSLKICVDDELEELQAES